MNEPNSYLLNVYQQLCSSYQEIDSFRAQLLGRLPLATGAGIFLLYVTGKDPLLPETKAFLPAIGLFGFIVTLGLFTYEVYGVRKCHALILAGKQMEAQLGVEGQFAHRPRSVLGQINEPFAAGVIYPAVLAAWAFLALAFVGPNWLPGLVAALVFFTGFVLTIRYNEWLKKDGVVKDLEFLNSRILQAEENGDAAFLAPLLQLDIKIVASQGRMSRQEFLTKVPTNAHRGREADWTNVELNGNKAVFECRVITNRNAKGKELFKFCHVTRCFEEDLHQQPGQSWICTSWHEAEIQEDAIGPSTT